MPQRTPARRARKPATKPQKSVLRQRHKKTVKKKPRVLQLMTLTGKQRSYLRGQAHDLSVILQLGKGGTSAALLLELGHALDSHELVKIRVLRECPEDLPRIAQVIEKKLKANVVATLGKILVLYRRNPDNCRIVLPKTTPLGRAKKPIDAEPGEHFDDDDDDDDEFDDSEDDSEDEEDA